jgi:hypothetical protein
MQLLNPAGITEQLLRHQVLPGVHRNSPDLYIYQRGQREAFSMSKMQPFLELQIEARTMEGSAIIVQTHCHCLIRQHQEKVLWHGVMNIQQVFSELKAARNFSDHLIYKDHRPGADD